MFRQTIMVGRVRDTQIVVSFRGAVRSLLRRCVVTRHRKVWTMGRVETPVRQVFQKLSCEGPTQQGDANINYFMEKLLPTLVRSERRGVLTYIPSYFDFVSLRNAFLKKDVSNFLSVTEY